MQLTYAHQAQTMPPFLTTWAGMDTDGTDTQVQPCPPPPAYEPGTPPPPPPDCEVHGVPCNPSYIKWRHEWWEFRGARRSRRADGTTIDVQEWDEHWIRRCMHCNQLYGRAIECGLWCQNNENAWERLELRKCVAHTQSAPIRMPGAHTQSAQDSQLVASHGA